MQASLHPAREKKGSGREKVDRKASSVGQPGILVFRAFAAFYCCDGQQTILGGDWKIAASGNEVGNQHATQTLAAVLQHCRKTSWIAMLYVFPPTLEQ